MKTMTSPQVTIVVVPRERFQFTQDSLESLYENTQYPFKLIYVDNNSPKQVRDYLAAQAEEKGFELVRSQHYLSPNQARNVGLQRLKTPYVIFVDNDIMFSSGWLSALVACAQETGATVVGSLVCQYKPLHTIVHCIGGDYMAPAEYAKFSQGELGPNGTLTEVGQWTIREQTYFQNCPIAEIGDQLKRQTTGFVEFHAMLVRASIFNRIGLLDEGFSCTKEYLDFCMTVTRAGGLIYFEPTSVVTFLTHPPAPRLERADLPYFMLRWSDEWERDSLLHFQTKWNLAESSYFQKRYKKLGQRRRKEIIKPIAAWFSYLGKPATKWLEKQLFKLEKVLNSHISARHQRLVKNAAIVTISEAPDTVFPEEVQPSAQPSTPPETALPISTVGQSKTAL